MFLESKIYSIRLSISSIEAEVRYMLVNESVEHWYMLVNESVEHLSLPDVTLM